MLAAAAALAALLSAGQLGASALSSSSALTAAASSTVTIGSAPNFWSSIPASPSSYVVQVGDAISFEYGSFHNVYVFNSQAAYESCDFSSAVELASASRGGGASLPNLFVAVATTPGTLYIACQVAGHCMSGQKVTITVNAPSLPVSPPPTTASLAPATVRIDVGGSINLGAGSVLTIGAPQ